MLYLGTQKVERAGIIYMYEFHRDRKRYFEIQIQNARLNVIPFLEEKFSINPGMRVLEVGCGEAGVLKAFLDKGCSGVGVELDKTRVEHAADWLKNDIESGILQLVSKNIFEADLEKDLGGHFHIIILKDVIEHIHDQAKLIRRLQDLLLPGGVIFFGFPPWQMPFGGHQQICRSKILSKLPYYHLLPAPLYRFILKKSGESWQELMEIRETGLSIEQFERIVKNCNFQIIIKKYYLINPIYQYKFGWKGRNQFKLLGKVPYLRNFFTTCVYYLIGHGSISTKN